MSRSNGATKSTKSRPPSEILDRQPPRDLDAEKGVIGSILLDPRLFDVLAAIVGPDDFYDEANQKLFAHALGIHTSGAKVDLTLLLNRFTHPATLN